MLTFMCPKGGALIQALTLEHLDAKRAIHAELWHATEAGRCRAGRQDIAPIHVASSNLAAMASFDPSRSY